MQRYNIVAMCSYTIDQLSELHCFAFITILLHVLVMMVQVLNLGGFLFIDFNYQRSLFVTQKNRARD